MGEFSVYHWLIVLFVVVLIFAGRKIPEALRGLGEGIHALKDSIAPTDSEVKASVDTRKDTDKKIAPSWKFEDRQSASHAVFSFPPSAATAENAARRRVLTSS
jgi:sec-independent protein translocase protein TatA